MSQPRFGYDNLLHRFRDSVWSASENDDNPLLNAFDLRPSSFWRPPVSRNILENPDFLRWVDPTNVFNWTKFGAGSTLARISSPIIDRPFAARLTRNGSDCKLQQDLADPELLRGLTLTFAIHLNTAVAGAAILNFVDSTGNTTSAFHTGGGTDEFISVTRTISPAATSVHVEVRMDNFDGSVDIDAGILIEGTSAPVTPSAPEEVILRLHAANGQKLRNWFFDAWPDGGGDLPAAWETVVGAPVVTRDSLNPKIGRYSMQTVGSGHIVGQEVDGDDLRGMLGKKVWVAVHADTASAAGQVRIGFVFRFRDGTLSSEINGTGGTAAHTGGGTYEWLTTSIRLPVDLTGVFIALVVGGGPSATVQWDGALMVEQSDLPSPTPHAQPVNAFAMHSHNAGSGGWTSRLEGSNDNFSTAPSLILTMLPTDDRTRWVDLDGAPVSYGSLQCRFTPGSNSGPLELAELFVGEYLEFPVAPLSPFENLSRHYKGELPKSRLAAPLGRSIPAEDKSYTITFELLDRSFVVADIIERLWEKIGGTNGFPFFFQWNNSDFPEETDFLWLGDEARLGVPAIVGLRVRTISFEVEGSIA